MVNRFINRLMYRAWVLVENNNNSKYVMIYSGVMGTEEFEKFPLSSPDNEKDILKYDGKRCTLFFNVSKGEYQILYMEGSFERFDAQKAKFSKLIGNIYETLYALVK